MAQTLLIQIPSPSTGHLFSAVKHANLLVGCDDRICVVMFIWKLPFDDSMGKNASALDPHPRVRFVYLLEDGTFRDTAANSFFARLVESNKPHVSRVVAELVSECESASPPCRLGGFLLDLFCTSMIDVADSFGVPYYMFFTSSTAFLDLLFYLKKLCDDYGKDLVLCHYSDEELAFPGLICPFPAMLLTSMVLQPETVGEFLDHIRTFRKTKGIIVNTFLELEPYPLKLLQSEPDLQKVYPVGPIGKVQDLGDIVTL